MRATWAANTSRGGAPRMGSAGAGATASGWGDTVAASRPAPICYCEQCDERSERGKISRSAKSGLKAQCTMWGRGKSRRSNPPRPEGPQPLRDAMRGPRFGGAERTGVVVDRRDAGVARLELVNDELEPVFA